MFSPIAIGLVYSLVFWSNERGPFSKIYAYARQNPAARVLFFGTILVFATASGAILNAYYFATFLCSPLNEAYQPRSGGYPFSLPAGDYHYWALAFIHAVGAFVLGLASYLLLTRGSAGLKEQLKK